MICVPISKLRHHSGHIHLFIVRSNAGCVARHEEIRDNPPATVDNAAEARFILLSRRFYAVGIVVFARSSPREQVGFVIFLVSRRERLLHATPGRGVISSHREAHHTSVAEFDGHLHKTFTKGASSDDGGAVIVLHRACKDLTGRSTRFVNEDNKRQTLISAASVALIFFLVEASSLGIDNESILRQEFIGHTYRGLQISPEISAQINDEMLHSLGTERGHCRKKVSVSVVSPRRNADVARGGIEHIRSIYTMNRHISADDGIFLHARNARTAHRQFDLASGLAFKPLHGAFCVDFLTYIGFAVDGHDAISGTQADIFRRPPGNHSNHPHRVIINGELHTDAGETAT